MNIVRPKKIKEIVFVILSQLILSNLVYSQDWTVNHVHESITQVFNIKDVSPNSTTSFMVQTVDTLESKNVLNLFIKNNQFILSYLRDYYIKNYFDKVKKIDITPKDLNELYHKKLMNDTAFVQCITEVFVSYLRSKGKVVEGFEVPSKFHLSSDVLFENCIQLFDKLIVRDKKILWILKRPITFVNKETFPLKQRLYINAFCNQAVMYWVSKRKWNQITYSNEFIQMVNLLNDQFNKTDISSGELLEASNKMKSIMLSCEPFKQAILEEHNTCSDWIGFQIIK